MNEVKSFLLENKALRKRGLNYSYKFKINVAITIAIDEYLLIFRLPLYRLQTFD